jgi:GntR family transcriptional regulator
MQKNVPLVEQVLQQIVTQIENGTLPRDGNLLPPEAELAQSFHVSRATVRIALDRLELAGVIVRRHGVGTYVNRLVSDKPAIIRGWFDQASRFMDFIQCSGNEASCSVIQTSIGTANRLAEQLCTTPDARVVIIEKLFSAASTPIVHCVNVVPLDLLQPAFREDAQRLLEQAESTYAFLSACAGRQVCHQDSEVRAVVAGEALSRWLGCQPDAPLLRVEEIGYGNDLVPLFHGINHFEGDRVSLLLVRRPAVNLTKPSYSDRT